MPALVGILLPWLRQAPVVVIASCSDGMSMDIGWKLVSTAAAVVAGLAATKALDASWRMVTGHHAPENEDESSLSEVVAFAALSAVVAAVARRYALRAAAKWYGGPNTPIPAGKSSRK